jgi:hypothetical protein
VEPIEGGDVARWTIRLVPLVIVLLVAAACGSQRTVAVLDAPPPDSPAASPYAGPMFVPVDHRDRATVMERSGAAGRALECNGKPYLGGGADYRGMDLYEIGDSAEEALANYVASFDAWSVPDRGYRVERTDQGRALLSYDVAGLTRVAIVLAEDIENYAGDTGWGVETWAQCDPSELPREVAERLGFGIWEDDDGRAVPVTQVQSWQGAEHCDWQDITFLQLGGDRRRQFVEDRKNEFGPDLLRTTFAADVELPADAEDTGYRREGRHLWLAADGTAAYLVGERAVERWPASKGFGCE